MSSIVRLPDSATRLISSHVVVVTPVSLVKELLENSIDAKATSIEILVSPDTVSKIEIRDDGVGIHPDDYDALGRRGHTSKLRGIDELGDVVGKGLGFRGEALASVNALAEVTITTKTSTEPVAATLQLIPDEGGILKQRSTSAPVGTTIRVVNLFGRQPVREQMAIKEAKKNLDKIQELLRSYAMARPQLKLVLRILQTPTKIWSYSPRPGANAAEAALQVFGVEAASNCLLKTVQSIHPDIDNDPPAQGPSLSTTHSFLLEALLANPEAELQNVPKRHYFSVDGRPINAGRGIAKKLLNIYMDHLKSSIFMMKNGVTDSFIRLNICCPSRSYDANVEPSKDDILFSDENILLDTFKRLCDDIYKPSEVGDKGVVGTVNTQPNNELAVDSQRPGYRHIPVRSGSPDCPPMISQNILRTPPKMPSYNSKRSVDQSIIADEPVVGQVSPEIRTSIQFTPINADNYQGCLQLQSPISPQVENHTAPGQWNVGMPVEVNECLERSRQQRQQGARESLSSQETITHGEHNRNGHLNPWVIAKTNSSSEVSPSKPDTTLEHSPGSPLNAEPSILRHTMAPPGDLDVPRSQQKAKSSRLPCPQRSIVPGGSYRSPVVRPSDSRPHGGSDIPLAGSHMALKRRRREQLPWTPPSPLERSQNADTFQVNPNHSRNTSGLKQTQISFGGAQANRRQVGSQGNGAQMNVGATATNDPGTENHSDLGCMFSTARQNLQYQLSQMKDNLLTETAPGHKRQQHRQETMYQRQPFGILQTNSFRNSEAPKEVQAPIATTLPAGDPRAYLLRRQKSIAAEESGAKPRKLRRLKSCLMPLENIPVEYQTYNLSRAVHLDGQVLDKLVREIRKYDEYVIYGTLVDGIDMNLPDGREIESRLQSILAGQKENIRGENNETMIDLQAALKGKGVADELLA